MHPYQRLLLVANPGLRHGLAVQRAAALAQASAAVLHMAVFEKLPSQLPFLDKDVQDSANVCHLDALNGWLRDEAQLLRSRGIQVTTEVAWSDALVQTILEHVEQSQPGHADQRYPA